MSSWAYGDPAPPVLRAHVWRSVKIRLIHGGIKETHVFHLHNHQWRLDPEDPKSTILDSISISPQECYTLDLLWSRKLQRDDWRRHLPLPPLPPISTRDVDPASGI